MILGYIVNIFLVVVCRFIMLGFIKLKFTKKEKKKYKSLNVFDRWFFWSMPLIINDKYSKYEKKIIQYSSNVVTYRFINLCMHISLIMPMVLIIFFRMGIVQDYFVDFMCGCLGWCQIATIIIVAIIEDFTFPRARKKRYKK